MAKGAKRQKGMNNVHVLQGDEAGEVGDPGTMDMELREDSREREVEELIEEEEDRE